LNYKYDISIVIPSFNQQDFIADTIESALSQEFLGTYEILISDDNSQDKTWEIIENYDHLSNVKTNRFEENTSYVGSYNWLIENSEGKYIAHLDGDDLFYPNKLQNAFDLLEADPGCSCVFHKVDVEVPSGDVLRNFINIDLDSLNYTYNFFVRHVCPFVNSSKVFRSKNALKLEGNLSSWQVYDYWLHLRHIGNGYARVCSSEELGLYRMLGGTAGRVYEEKLIAVYDHLALKSSSNHSDINASIGVSIIRKILRLRKVSLKEVKLFFTTLSKFKIKKYCQVIHMIYHMKMQKK
jgi:glycosyltransferase involved in cell wall biosynthesis